MLNRIEAQLRMKSQPVRALQADWNAHGAPVFDFEVIDLLPAREDAVDDQKAELEMLEQMWREKLGLDPSTIY